ncbi:DNA-processing protein DprA [Bacillus infantis]|uniref:DNA-processing protein DprA n=1 Tax=Bacillus infantis TaxID=324767 RepID=UPI002003380F|nr:DNA-processing protein DprA [Bacillus infantis]MCK6208489.1 DNA-protecting protein DprA [Bacillus infantis]MCP1161449.1 DNA-protecting protein DprA [Bacillus infantis]
MNLKEMIFVLYDLGISTSTLSRLYKEADEKQIQQLLEGEYLELQFSLGVFSEKELKLLSSLESIQQSVANISRTLKEFEVNKIEYFLYYDDEYPKPLKNIPSPPLFIFMKGNKNILNNQFVCSIVGTRNPAASTLDQIELTVRDLVSADIAIASGLAIGTDIYAHKCTLNEYGKAIAVLPGPVNNVIPKSHNSYANEILAKNGLLVSEYYKTEFKKTNYIHRNRIISGLSDAVIIAECSEKSGTMHTARFAYKQKKPLFCFNNTSSGVLKILSSNSAKVFKGVKDFHL